MKQLIKDMFMKHVTHLVIVAVFMVLIVLKVTRVLP